ncbi:unnamed protein product [Calypogeia fissa]
MVLPAVFVYVSVLALVTKTDQNQTQMSSPWQFPNFFFKDLWSAHYFHPPVSSDSYMHCGGYQVDMQMASLGASA